MAKRNGKDERYADIDRNRRAFYEYEILERLEAGLVLQGTEVKGLRARGASIRDAYAQFRGGEAWLVGLHIADWDQPGLLPTDPRRSRSCSSTGARSSRGLEGRRARPHRGAAPPLLQGRSSEGGARPRPGQGGSQRRAIAERDARREMDRAVKAVRRAWNHPSKRLCTWRLQIIARRRPHLLPIQISELPASWPRGIS